MIQSRPGQNIVWLASYPRSGNTWTRIFLHNLFQVLEGKAAGPADINDLERYSTWESDRRHFDRAAGRPLDPHDWRLIASVRPRVQAALAQRAKATLLVKTHLANVAVAGVPAVNPAVTAGAVYIVRNPLDVAVSLAPHLGVSIDEAIGKMADFHYALGASQDSVHEVVSSWNSNVDGWTREPSPRLLVLRYEDLVAEPIEHFGRLAQHLGLRPSEDQLATAVAYSSFDAARRQEDEAGFKHRAVDATDRFFRVGKAGGWREKLSAEQVGRIVAAHGTTMARFGYTDGI